GAGLWGIGGGSGAVGGAAGVASRFRGGGAGSTAGFGGGGGAASGGIGSTCPRKSSTRASRSSIGAASGAMAGSGDGRGTGTSFRGSPQISHSGASDSLSAPQIGQRTMSRMSSSAGPTSSASGSNSAAQREHLKSPAATQPPPFVPLNRRATSP